jgi:thioester reductase-like protein
MFVDPEGAVGSGYGESKWVSEKILSLVGQAQPFALLSRESVKQVVDRTAAGTHRSGRHPSFNLQH